MTKTSGRQTLLRQDDKSDIPLYLFFSEEQPNRHPFNIEAFTKTIFKIILIRLFYIVGEIAEKSKGRNRCRQLGYIFNAYRMPSYHRCMVLSYCILYSFI